MLFLQSVETVSGLNDLLKLKKQHSECKMVLHFDQGSVYNSKEQNNLLRSYSVIHSVSCAENVSMESINRWAKSELLTDFYIQGKNIREGMQVYSKFLNEERPTYSLGYVTPRQHRKICVSVQQIHSHMLRKQFLCPIYVNK